MHTRSLREPTKKSDRRHKLVDAALVVGILVVLLGLVTTAMANHDDGMHTSYLEQIQRQPAAAQPEVASPTPRALTTRGGPDRQASRARVLDVPRRLAMPHRASEHRIASAPKPAARVATAVNPTRHQVSVTSIYKDRTLRRGDVVILAKGPLVFAGTQQFPYAERDFIAFAKAPGVGKQLQHDLTAIASNQFQRS